MLNDGSVQTIKSNKFKEDPKSLQRMVEKRLRKEIRNLTQYSWYWGAISKAEADEKLEGTADGSFLIRDSTSEQYEFSISFRSVGNTLHSRIGRTSNGYKLFDDATFSTITQLVEYAMNQSEKNILCYTQNRDEPNFPVKILKPVSRNNIVRSLQSICRFVIRQCVEFEDIELLHLPVPLLAYVKEKNYIT